MVRILRFQLNLNMIMNEEKGAPAHNYRNLYKHKDEKKHEDYQSTYNFYEQEPQELYLKGLC